MRKWICGIKNDDNSVELDVLVEQNEFGIHFKEGQVFLKEAQETKKVFSYKDLEGFGFEYLDLVAEIQDRLERENEETN